MERLLEAYDQKLTCPPEEKQNRVATFERLLNRRTSTSRDALLEATQLQYQEFRRFPKRV